MKLKSLIFLVPLYLSLISCVGETSSSISPESLNTTEDFEETTTQINHKYLHLLDTVERLRIYVEEEKEKFAPGGYVQESTQLTEIKKSQHIEQLKTIINTFSELVERVCYEHTLQLIKGQISIDKYLEILLTVRFFYLGNRKHGIKAYLSTYRAESIHVIPTSTRLFNWLSQDGRFEKHKEYNNLLRVIAIQKFEALNLLIREAFRSCHISELTDGTIELLRKSIQLHPLLAGTSQDLGHPDAATGDYALLEELIFDPDDDKKNGNCYKEDFTSRLLNLIDRDIKRISELNSKTKDHEKALKLLAQYLYNANKATPSERSKGENKLIDKLLVIRKKLDIEVFEAHTIITSNTFYITNETPALNVHLPTQSTKYEAGIWPYELPYPSFLKITDEQPLSQVSAPATTPGKKPTKNQRKKQRRRQTHNTMKGIKKEVRAKQEGVSDLSPIQPSNDITIVQNKVLKVEEIHPSQLTKKEEFESKKGKGKLIIEKEDEEQESVRDENAQNASKLTSSLNEELGEGIIVSSLENIQLEEQTITTSRLISRWSFERDWVLPRGLRIFHHTMFPSPYPAHKSKTHANIINRLFNPQQACTITFKEFHTLWLSEGGKVGNSGGSHKELIGPDLSSTIKGKPLFGIFAHGNNQTYGLGYLKYLQTAVLYIGLRPDEFIIE